MATPNLLSLLLTSLIVSSLCFIVICNADAGGDKHEYNYEEDGPNGPMKWGTLEADWKICSTGKSQSPIDIDPKKAKEQPSDLKRAYKEAPAKISNKGHAIVVEWQEDAGGIEVNGSTYKLVQCHWHTPSEHTIDGKRYDAELHFVHKNDNDQLAVIGILYSIGESDPFIANAIKDKIKGLSTDGKDLGKISANSSTSDSKTYFRYFGSLTTPPCSEGVIWTVAEKAKTISEVQIKLIKGALEHDFQENARPVEELNGRQVTQFEDKEGGEDADNSGKDSSASILNLWNGIIVAIFIQIGILFLF